MSAAARRCIALLVMAAFFVISGTVSAEAESGDLGEFTADVKSDVTDFVINESDDANAYEAFRVSFEAVKGKLTEAPKGSGLFDINLDDVPDISIQEAAGKITVKKAEGFTATDSWKFDLTAAQKAALEEKGTPYYSSLKFVMPRTVAESSRNKGTYVFDLRKGSDYADLNCDRDRFEDALGRTLRTIVDVEDQIALVYETESYGHASLNGDSVSDIKITTEEKDDMRLFIVTPLKTRTCGGDMVFTISDEHKAEYDKVTRTYYFFEKIIFRLPNDTAGAGSSQEDAEKVVDRTKGEKDIKGSSFSPLLLKTTKVTKTYIKLSWSKVKGASRYVLYAQKCGKKNSMKKLKTLTKNAYTVKKAAGKKLKKGTYYKFLVIAYDKDGTVKACSKLVHEAAAGGKPGRYKAVKTAAKKNKASVSYGKPFSLKGKAVLTSKKHKVTSHRKIMYESSDPTIASVSAKGVITGIQPGTCYVYAYAQNGVYAKIKVTAK